MKDNPAVTTESTAGAAEKLKGNRVTELNEARQTSE